MKQPWLNSYIKKTKGNEIPDITIYEQLKKSANNYPNNIAIEYLNKTLKYSELLSIVDHIAVGFEKLGVKQSDVITIALPNIPEVVFALYALNKLGAVCNITHPLDSENDINYTLKETNSKIIVTIQENYKKIKNNKTLEKIIIANPTDFLDIDVNLSTIKDDRLISFKNYFKNIEKKEINIKRNTKDDIAVILHSGGTTGKIKHVVIQNKAFLNETIGHTLDLVKMIPGTSYIVILPNFHGYGLNNCITSPLANGCKIILVPRFEASKFDELIDQTKPNAILGVPSIFEALINCHNVENLDLSFSKYWLCGGDQLSNKLEEEVNKFLKEHGANIVIKQGYGLTETLSCICGWPDEMNKSGSVGVMFYGMKSFIVDPHTDKELNNGEIGEFIVTGNSLMLKYLNDEEATKKVLKKRSDGNTYLYTGDLASKDDDGLIYYKGRIKRMFISNGYNIYPSYIEDMLKQHKAVFDASVVDIELKTKKVGIAFIILNKNYDESVKEELFEYCKNNFPRYMWPKDIIFKKEFPKNKIGKTDFIVLKKEYLKYDTKK